MKKSKEDLVNYLIENYSNRQERKIDLRGLDFEGCDLNIDISGLKTQNCLFQHSQDVGLVLWQDKQKVKDYLYQGNQEVGGELHQSHQKVEGDLSQHEQIVRGNLYQNHQKVVVNLFQHGQKVKGDLYQDTYKRMTKTEIETALGHRIIIEEE